MVSFVCDTCQSTLKKPKLLQHTFSCNAVFSCIDCAVTFRGTDWKAHTSCITEVEKFQKTKYVKPVAVVEEKRKSEKIVERPKKSKKAKVEKVEEMIDPLALPTLAMIISHIPSAPLPLSQLKKQTIDSLRTAYPHHSKHDLRDLFDTLIATAHDGKIMLSAE